MKKSEYQATNQEALNTYLEIAQKEKVNILMLFSEVTESFLLNSDTDLAGADKVNFQNFTDTIRKVLKNA